MVDVFSLDAPEDGYRAAIGWLIARLGTDQLYVFTHDLALLAPIDGGDPIELSLDDIDRFADAEPVDNPRGLLVPCLDGENPVLVARRADGAVIAGRDRLVVGTTFARMLARFERLEQLRRRTSMSAAGQIQWDELPTRAMRTGDLRAAGTLAPAYEVAGDLFDLAIDPDGTLSVVSLDAMGHGVTAALSAVLALSAIRTTRREGGSLDEQMLAADSAIAEEYGGDRFVTGVVVEINEERIAVVNAGHEPMRRYGPSGPVGLSLPAQPPLGVEGRTDYTALDLAALGPGDSLAILSDGVSGAAGPGGAVYGADAIDALVMAAGQIAPLAVSHRLAEAVTEHSGGELQDDVTAVVVEFTGS